MSIRNARRELTGALSHLREALKWAEKDDTERSAELYDDINAIIGDVDAVIEDYGPNEVFRTAPGEGG